MPRLHLREMAKTPSDRIFSDPQRNIERDLEEKMEIEIPGNIESENLRNDDEEFNFSINREPFSIKTDSEQSDMDSDTKDRDNFVENSYEEMIGNSIESEISKISNNFEEELDENEILSNPLYGDSPLESPNSANLTVSPDDSHRIIDDAQILAQNSPKGPRECRFCGREVPWGKHVKYHERRCGMRPPKEKPMCSTPVSKCSCRHCGESFPNSSTLKQHMKLVHIDMVSTGGIQVTPDNGRSLRRRNDSANSLSNSPDENISPQLKRERKPARKFEVDFTPTRKLSSYYCTKCGKEFVSKAVYENHMKCVHAQKSEKVVKTQHHHSELSRGFDCPWCEKSFLKKAHCKTHCINVHGVSDPEFKEHFPDERRGPGRKAPLSNVYLSRSYSAPSRSKKHFVRFEELFVLKRRYSNDEDEKKENASITCTVCDTEFEDQAEFTKHVQKKHRAKFRRSQAQEDLKRSHPFDSPNVKERRKTLPLTRKDSVGDKFDCERTSESSNSSTESGFPCKYCGRTFESKANRIVHETLHTREKPFQCSICLKAFPCFTYLTSHLELAHNLLKG